MATENLTIEQRKVSTASFNVNLRILTIPILDADISPELYDLFMGHEVGHALFTPKELLTQSQEQKLTFSVVNVIEDVRIERKIRSKYPGLKQPFIKGYHELIEKDFFGTKDTIITDLNFIDRTNLYFKLGVNSKITFTNPIELKLIDEITLAETIEDVLVVSKKVMEYLKDERIENSPEFDDIPWQNLEDEIEESDDYYDDYDDDSETEYPDRHDNGEVESLTDKAFQKNQSKLFADDLEYYYGNIPDINLDEIIIPHRTVWGKCERWLNLLEPADLLDITKQRTEDFQKFRKDSKKVVNYLVKEFELRKNADQLKRSAVAKSGEINMDAIFSYKISEDIFKKITIVPGGKSHGLVLFLDWSGSMHNDLNNTVKQLLSLVLFCKQINIPFEVYAFTSTYSKQYNQKFKENDLAMFDGVSMLNMLSSTMTTKEFNYAAAMLLYVSGNISRCHHSGIFRLGSTPLNAAIVVAMKILPKFKTDYKLQNVNVVFLTDGASDSATKIYYTDGTQRRMGTGDIADSYTLHSKSLIICDPKSKHQEKIKDVQQYRDATTAYLKLLKSITNCNIIGFYIINRCALHSEFSSIFKNTINLENLKAEFRSNNYKVVKSEGYDEYYLLRAEGLDTKNDNEYNIKKNATTRGIASSFAKFTSKRTTNRVILNRFISMIS